MGAGSKITTDGDGDTDTNSGSIASSETALDDVIGSRINDSGGANRSSGTPRARNISIF